MLRSGIPGYVLSALGGIVLLAACSSGDGRESVTPE
jgi:hypothetical protein